MTRLRVVPHCPAGMMFVMTDSEHPEACWPLADDVGENDGSVLVCHPADEEAVRDILANVGEYADVNEVLTAFRKAGAR